MTLPKLRATCVSWAASGRALAVGTVGATLVWSRAGARVLKRTGAAAPMYVVAFSPDEQLVACGTESKSAKLFTREGARVATLSGDSGIVSHLSFDSTGSRILAGRALWDGAGHALKRKTFSMISVFVDDALIASAGPDHPKDLESPALWLMTPDGEVVRRVPLAAPAAHIATDGARIVVTYGMSAHVTIFDAKGEPIGDFVRHRSGHRVSGVSLCADRVASGGFGDTEIWVSGFDGRDPKRIEGYARPTQSNGIAFARRSPRLLATLGGEQGAGTGGDCAVVHDLESGGEVRLYSTASSWLAVGRDGLFLGDPTLSATAMREDPGVLEALFVA